jgi:hypothetical protein
MGIWWKDAESCLLPAAQMQAMALELARQLHVLVAARPASDDGGGAVSATSLAAALSTSLCCTWAGTTMRRQEKRPDGHARFFRHSPREQECNGRCAAACAGLGAGGGARCAVAVYSDHELHLFRPARGLLRGRTRMGRRGWGWEEGRGR